MYAFFRVISVFARICLPLIAGPMTICRAHETPYMFYKLAVHTTGFEFSLKFKILKIFISYCRHFLHNRLPSMQ